MQTGARSGTGGSRLADGKAGIQEITSSDGSVIVTNPNGPVTDLSVSVPSSQFITAVGITAVPIPDGARFLYYDGIGGSGGGGSGAVAPAGFSGGGGQSGGRSFGWISVAQLIATLGIGNPLSITVGAGGVGGAGQTVDNSPGNAGTFGGDTLLDVFYRCGGGMGGTAGGTATSGGLASLGGAGTFKGNSGAGGVAVSTGTAGNPGPTGLAGTGSGGSGASGGGLNNAGGAGGARDVTVPPTVIAAGGAVGAIGNDGATGLLTQPSPGGGGSGSGGGAGVANSLRGGHGGLYGGAGGGSGTVSNGFDSGPGGDGASGCMYLMWI